jgi:hypothetical protein
MIDLIWWLIARFVAQPRIVRLIKWWAFRHPYIHLEGYMERWHVIPFSWRLPFAVRLHHILRPDKDPKLHDHPWNWRSIILDGYYIEEDVFGQMNFRGHGETRAANAETFHRIDFVRPGGVWTLFISYRYRNRWGFMTGSPPRKIYYREYLPEGEIRPGPMPAGSNLIPFVRNSG